MNIFKGLTGHKREIFYRTDGKPIVNGRIRRMKGETNKQLKARKKAAALASVQQ